MTLLILASLIWAGVVPTRQEANTYQIKQTIRETFTITGKDNQQTFTYPVSNISGVAITRTIRIYTEFNVTNNIGRSDVLIELKIFDLESVTGSIYSAISSSDRKFGYTSLNEVLSVKRRYLFTVTVYGSNASGILQGIIVQDVQKS